MPRLLRPLLLLLVVLALMLAAGQAAYQVAQRLGLADLQATGVHRLDLYSASLEREIGKYAFLPGTLALQPTIVELLSHPSANTAAAANTFLEQLSDRAGTLAIYVMDRQGSVRAASNWRRADSFLQEDLSFRPYFRDAMDTGNGRFFGIGTTRGEPGYYLASSLIGPEGLLGVAVTKVGLETLEKSWSTVEAPVLVADENGVVILSSVPDWKFTTLRPLDDETRKAFDHTQQYNRRALQPLGITELDELERGARLVSIAREGPEMVSVYPVTGRFVAQSRPLPGTPWTLTVLSQQEQVDDLARTQAALGAIGAACLFMLAIIINERRRHLKDRLAAREALQKAHDELERKVVERTADLSATNQRLQDEISERIRAERTLRAAQDELVQAGKLAVVGQLSTGIAHELNQPLAALRTLSANTSRFLERGDLETTQANLQRIADLTDRMGHITGQLRNFARKSSGTLGAVNLGHALDNALALLEPRLRQSAVTIQRDMPGDAILVFGDANRLEQVLVNLIGNALDAMSGQSTPKLAVSCIEDDDCVTLAIHDDGPGLTEEILPRLFEPFFTTKPAGEGLGLGLAISAGIVRDFGGTLRGANHPEGGAVFTLELPRATSHV